MELNYNGKEIAFHQPEKIIDFATLQQQYDISIDIVFELEKQVEEIQELLEAQKRDLELFKNISKDIDLRLNFMRCKMVELSVCRKFEIILCLFGVCDRIIFRTENCESAILLAKKIFEQQKFDSYQVFEIKDGEYCCIETFGM